MRRLITLFTLMILFALAYPVTAQQTFNDDKVEYTLELPSPVWKAVSGPDSIQERTEFVYGDRMDGYLRIRKEAVDAATDLSELARHDQEQKLRYLPGYVEGKKQEKFSGRYDGLTATYEFIRMGKPMLGRIYYLRVDNRTVYMLHFTGLRDKLERIRNQTDLIARSFKLK